MVREDIMRRRTRIPGFWLAAATTLWLSSIALARDIPITVLYTTDLHGQLVSRISGKASPNETGGLLQVASLIEKIRAEEPHALLVDCGDTFQGGPEAYLSKGRILLDAMEYLHYDVWVPGNHEFDWGLEILKPLVRDAPCAVLGANIQARFGAPHPLPEIRPYLVREIDGIRVAVVGLTTPSIPLWTLPDYLGDVFISRSVPALENILPALKAENVDIRILIVHQGLSQGADSDHSEIQTIARDFPEFDLILGGHTHQRVEREIVGGTLFSQAECYGKTLGRATLVYNTVARKIIRRSAELLPVEADTPVHPELKVKLAPWIARVDQAWAQRIGFAAHALDARSGTPGDSAIDRLFREAIGEACDAEIVLHGALTPEGLDAGTITEQDLWRIVPFDNRIGVVHLTFGDLRIILEENIERGGTRFMGLLGASARYDPEAPAGRRIRTLTLPDGSVPHARRRFRVAINSYVLASGGGRFKELRQISEQPESQLTLLELQTRDVVRSYIRKHNPLSLSVDREDGLRSVSGLTAPRKRSYSSPKSGGPLREARGKGY